MKLKQLPGIAVGTSLGLGTAAATADNKEDAFMRGVMFGLGGSIMGAKSEWMQEAGRDIGREAFRAVRPGKAAVTKRSISKIKIPDSVKKDLAANIGSMIKKPGSTVGKSMKFVGKSMIRALGSIGIKKGILALGLL